MPCIRHNLQQFELYFTRLDRTINVLIQKACWIYGQQVLDIAERMLRGLIVASTSVVAAWTCPQDILTRLKPYLLAVLSLHFWSFFICISWRHFVLYFLKLHNAIKTVQLLTRILFLSGYVGADKTHAGLKNVFKTPVAPPLLPACSNLEVIYGLVCASLE